jgi:NADPH:quinone reductase-like Zn-dependent oxidoreductase
MRAVVFRETGGLDKLELIDLPEPELAEDEVLVQVKACALNHLDVWVRKGLPTPIPMPHIGGCEVAGIVRGVGRGVRDWKVGQRVLVSPGQACMRCEWCAQGLDNLCQEFRIHGYQTQGGLAEFTKARSRDLLAISDAWSFAEWSAVPLTFVTAWNMLHERCALKPGDDVLVMGASSGVGVAAIQIAKHAGARVLAVTGSDEKCRRALDLGADLTLNYLTQDVAKEVKRITNGRGVDIVFEHVGQALWMTAMRCLARNGRLVTCGATTGPKVEIDLRFFFTQQFSVTGAHMGSRADLLTIMKLVERRELRPVVDSIQPLAETRAAQERLEQRLMFGKIVVAPTP